MTFLNPALLAGLFALGVPIAIHLLTRPRFRDIRWAAMQFILPGLKKSRRLSRLEDLCLLLLRCLLVALLVLIFARPARLVDPAELAKADATTTRVLILDQSASMGRSDGLRTRFALAQAEADAFLAAQAPEVASSFFLATDRVRRVVSRPTTDRTQLRAAAASASITDGGSDLFPAIKSAVELLNKERGRREIIVFTDNQAVAWRQQTALRTLLADSPGIVLQVHAVAPAPGPNLALIALQPKTAVSAVDQPVPFAIEVANRSVTAVAGFAVKLSVDGASPVAETFVDRLEAGATRTVTLTAKFGTPGAHSVTASLPPDLFDADNRRACALQILPQLSVLVIENPARAGALTDSYFLSRALVPVPPAEAGRYFIKATVANPAELTTPALENYPLIFLSNVARLTAAEVKNLRRHVAAGATLVVFPGAATDLDFFNTDPDFSALLPAQLDYARPPATQNKLLSWQSHDYPHPLTALWNDPAAGHLGAIALSRYFPFKDPAAALDAEAIEVIVRYGNGEPAVLARNVDRGHVILFSSPAAPGWTTLPLHPAFVPLLLRIAAQASGQTDDSLNLEPGRAWTATVGSDAIDAPVSVLRPGETTRRDAGQVEASARAATLHYADTGRAGVYRLFVGDEARPRAQFAVQLPPDESDPAVLSPADLALLTAPPAPPPPVAATATPKSVSPLDRVPGEELWAQFALAALVFALVETALAHLWSRAKN